MRLNNIGCLTLLVLGAFSLAGCPAPSVPPTPDTGVDSGIRPDGGVDSGRDAGGDGGGGECATGCLVGTTCHPNGTVNPTNPCEICDHSESATAFSANDGASCDDGLFCTTNDECSARACTGTARSCDDSIACNGVATCDETTSACLPGTPTCGAGELCDATSGDCVTTCPGCAVGTSCYGDGQVNPGNDCEACDVAVSRTEFSANDGASCDDGSFCTTGDVCAARTCSGAGARCGDSVDCNGAETCDETADSCVAGTTTCSASQICDVASDTCVATCTGCVIGGACIGAGQRNPVAQCEVCDPTVSTTAYVANDGASCDDGLFCTSSDVCTGTTCGGAPRACSDGIACNGAETCSETADTCMPGTSTCGGGTACDPGTDACVATCAACTIAGSCYGAGQVNPMNPCEVCSTSAPTVWSANNGAVCDDGLFCTDADRCSARACSGTARVCSDGVSCNGTETCSETLDRCNPGTTTCGATQVCNTTTDMCVTTCSGCVVGGTCYAPGSTNPTNACQVCDISRSRSAFSTNDGAPCNDGAFCTRGDVCSGGLCAGSSATNFCSDGVSCNGTETCNEGTDACVAGATTCAAGQVCNPATDMCVTACTGCVIGGVCYAPSTINPSNQCQICRTATPTVWSTNTGATCNDGNFCTAVDTCNASAVCTGTTRDCSDGAACSGTETCNESTDRCDAGTTLCPAGQTCDVPTDTCVITCAGCVIGGVCYAPDTLNGCQACRPLVSTTSWTNLPDGTSCDDRAYCTTADVCSAGACVGGPARDCRDAITCNGAETCNEMTDSCDPVASTCMTGTFCDTSGGPPGTCSSTCAGTICGTTCSTLATDPDHCGSCTNTCASRPNTTRLCGGSPAACMYSCLPNFLDCNGGVDGCEVNRQTDPNNCGVCGNVCPVGAPFCSAGACTTLGAFPIPYAPEVIGGTFVGLGDDQMSGALPLGFTFRFFGVDYTQVFISSNGWVAFENTPAFFPTRTIPSGDGCNNAIYFNNTDLYPPGGGSIQYELRGTAPNRRFVISVTSMPWFPESGTSRVTSQTILFEGTNRIEVHTANQTPGRSYTQGVENAAGTTAFFLPGRVNASYGLTNDAVAFFTN